MRTTLIICLSILSSAVVAEARNWTDSTGEQHLNAEFVSLAEGKVQLQTPAGRNFSIALASLSAADRKVVFELNKNLQPTEATADESATPQTLTAALQLGNPGSASAGIGSTAGGSLAEPSGGLQMRQTPAPLPLDSAPGSGPNPSAQDGQLPPAGGQQAAVPGKDKRIFSGCKSTFQLYSRDGTGAYWLHGKHYLAKLTFQKTEGNYVSFTSSGEGGVEAWAFRDVDSCGPSRVYAAIKGSSGWKLFDHDSREQPN